MSTVKKTPTVIIGAGPYGLSISAYLGALGIEHRLIGRPVDTWRHHMPTGMMLRSEPYGSDIAAPGGQYDVGTYSRDQGRAYVDRLGPLSREHWLDYVDSYVDRYRLEAEDLTVTNVAPGENGFTVSFGDDAPSCVASRVVVATGVAPFPVLPGSLGGFPRDLVTHTIDHHDLRPFAGRRVAVVGGGQSAMETTALLHEAGADVTAVVRRPAINWLAANPERLSAVGHLRRPVNKLCEGWHCAFWNEPALFRKLPADLRLAKAKSVLGPAGAWWLKDRVEGVVPLLTGHEIERAERHASGVRLHLTGERRTLDVDHVICGTGFRVDLARLAFLPLGLREAVATFGGYPVVSRSGESKTVAGLFFAGAPAAASLGPSARFIAGTHTTAKQLARRVAAGTRSTSRSSDLRASAARPAAGEALSAPDAL